MIAGSPQLTQQPSTPPSVVATKISVRFGLSKRVLKNVSFSFQPGEIVCILGPNGAGKTTLLNLLAGCLFKTRNRITIFGLNRWRRNMDIRRRSTYVPATRGFSIGKTPYEHFCAIALLYGMDQDAFAQRCSTLVSDMGFASQLHKEWITLSPGLYHKAMLIGGFLPPAELRILDEPVASGIDALGMEIVGVWMKEARDRGETIVFSTQVLDRAHLMSDRILILGQAKAVFWGTPRELILQAGFSPDDDYALNRAFLKLFQGSDD